MLEYIEKCHLLLRFLHLSRCESHIGGEGVHKEAIVQLVAALGHNHSNVEGMVVEVEEAED
jgi:hypothetical protein